MENLHACLEARKAMLPFYYPYNFIKEQQPFTHADFVEIKINEFASRDNHFIFNVEIQHETHYFYYQFLPWDSEYFGIPTCKLFIALYGHGNIHILSIAIEAFFDHLRSKSIEYVLGEVPAEDQTFIQALCLAKSKLVETRLTYYRANLHLFEHERYPVKMALPEHIPQLRKVAVEMRNPNDRVHADPAFDQDKADAYLATFTENCIKGFADLVLMPALENDSLNNAFLAANHLKSEWDALGYKVSKFALTAVSSKTNRGWLKKLTVEMTYHLRELGTEYISTSTQAGNRAVIHTWESLGYKLGSTSFIFSTEL